MVALTNGRDVGAGWPPKRRAAAVAAWGVRAVAVVFHQMLQVTTDVGRHCRQARAPVIESPAGEIPPAGDVGAPGVG